MTEFEPGSGSQFETEIDHGHAAYTPSELLEQCQLNAQGFILAAFSAVDGDPAAVSQIVERVADTFAASWNTERDWDPNAVLDALLVNYRSFGATIESSDLDADAPSAVLTGLPNPELANLLEVPATSFRPMLAIAQHLAARMGCNLEWSHDAPSGRIRLQVERAS